MEHTKGRAEIDASKKTVRLHCLNSSKLLTVADCENDGLPPQEQLMNCHLVAEAFNVSLETGKTPRQLQEENEKMEGEINAFAEWIGRTGFIKAHSIDRFIPNDTGGFYWFYTGYDSKFSQKYFTSSELREFFNKE